MSAYRGEWPVNRIAQGADVPSNTPVQGLYLVGDAVKPSGYLMVEGVAQSVNHFLDLLDKTENGWNCKSIAAQQCYFAALTPECASLVMGGTRKC